MAAKGLLRAPFDTGWLSQQVLGGDEVLRHMPDFLLVETFLAPRPRPS
jgi:hypothetical protein